jgi:hypothetical protein
MSSDGANVRELRPSTDTMTSCRFRSRLTTIAARLPSGDTAAGS